MLGDDPEDRALARARLDGARDQAVLEADQDAPLHARGGERRAAGPAGGGEAAVGETANAGALDVPDGEPGIDALEEPEDAGARDRARADDVFAGGEPSRDRVAGPGAGAEDEPAAGTDVEVGRLGRRAGRAGAGRALSEDRGDEAGRQELRGQALEGGGYGEAAPAEADWRLLSSAP